MKRHILFKPAILRTRQYKVPIIQVFLAKTVIIAIQHTIYYLRRKLYKQLVIYSSKQAEM